MKIKMRTGSFHNLARGGICRASALSLAEVLIVVAVIGILAAIGVPMLMKNKAKLKAANCQANLKQIGTALRLYSAENNDWLPPGPSDGGEPKVLSTLQAPCYGMNATFKKWLPYYLATYLSLPAPSSVGKATNIAEVFICPAYVASMPGNSVSGYYVPVSDNYGHAYSYAVTRSLTGTTGKYQLPSRPFGEKGVSGPLRLKDIQAVAPLSDVYALADIDAAGVVNPTSLGDNSLPYVAKTPVHETLRNLLYFDGHVDANDITTMKKY